MGIGDKDVLPGVRVTTLSSMRDGCVKNTVLGTGDSRHDDG